MGRAISTQPDPEVVQTSFRGIRPALFDFFTAAPSRQFRAVAVKRLALQPGDAVIDLGCGTGLSLPLLVDAVGPGGQVIGVDASPHMLARARRRVEAAGWRGVELVEAFAQDFQPPSPVDGVLAGNVNQLICSPEVVRNAVDLAEAGGTLRGDGQPPGPRVRRLPASPPPAGHGPAYAAGAVGRALDPAGAALAGAGAGAGAA